MDKNGIAIVDDHLLFARSLMTLVSHFEEYEVLFHAENGKDFIARLENGERAPDLVLLDINMPVMDGLETMAWVKENHPGLKVIALSMDNSEATIIRMLRLGARGYLLKDIHPDILKTAIDDVLTKGFYFSDQVSRTMLDSMDRKDGLDEAMLKDREVEFLRLACTEKTYKEIAEEMFLSPKTVDGYREVLFDKLEVKSRTGLVLYAIKHKVIEV